MVGPLPDPSHKRERGRSHHGSTSETSGPSSTARPTTPWPGRRSATRLRERNRRRARRADKAHLMETQFRAAGRQDSTALRARERLRFGVNADQDCAFDFLCRFYGSQADTSTDEVATAADVYRSRDDADAGRHNANTLAWAAIAGGGLLGLALPSHRANDTQLRLMPQGQE